MPYWTDTWILYAAAYVNDVETVQATLKPLRVGFGDRRSWRWRLSTNYQDHKDEELYSYFDEDRNCCFYSTEEHVWINMISIVLTIAASLGHTRLISRVLEIEPLCAHRAFKTCYTRDGINDLIDVAIVHNQLEVFELLKSTKWPLITRTGFVCKTYYAAIDTALRHLHHGFDDKSILGSLLDMSDEWQCPYMLKTILRYAAEAKNIEFLKAVSDRLSRSQRCESSFYWLQLDLSHTAPWRWSSYKFTLTLAADDGHIELIELLLNLLPVTYYSESDVILDALSTIIVDTHNPSDNQLKICDILLTYTIGPMLEELFIKAILRWERSPNLTTLIARYLDTSATTASSWSTHLEERSKGPRLLRDTEVESSSNTENLFMVGELALAASLFWREWSIAKMLIESHGCLLKYCFVETNFRAVDSDLRQELTEMLISKGMSVEYAPLKDPLEHPLYVESVIFRPKPHPDVVPFRLAFEHWELYDSDW